MKPAPEPRFASLTAGLLARKGEARPAMRSGDAQGSFVRVHDDLGWNDMVGPPPVVPEPIRRQAEIAAALDAVQETAAPEPAPALTDEMIAEIAARAAATKGKAAFTLRLDAARHLRLRLACAVSNRSAQALVTQALDALLQTMPALDALTDACPATQPGDA